MTVVLLVLTFGINLFFWSTVGILRWISARVARAPRSTGSRVRPHQVAVLVAAHNEERGVADTVAAALRLVPRGNVFVVSDGSRDATVDQAAAAGAVVYDLQPNRGKAGALAAGIEHFDLAGRFEVMMLLDADTVPAADYLETGLPMFDDPDVVAVAGHASTIWDREDRLGLLGQVLRAYRERVYVAFQLLLKYGQAARHTDSVMIVPGFASMYRTRVLEFIDIAAPGLAIEDFNMTFEVHRKRLGRVAFHPGSATAYTQDPHILKDYVKQVGRWSLGFWQTVRRHGLHRGRFWLATAAYVLELLTSSVMFVLLGPAFLLTVVAVTWVGVHGVHGPVDEAFVGIITALPLRDYLLGVVVPDYLLTIFAAIRQRRPAYLLLGLAFLPLRCLDAVLCLRSLWRSRSAHSAGTWTSPTRRGVAPVAVAIESMPTVVMAVIPAQGVAPIPAQVSRRAAAPAPGAYPAPVAVPAQRPATALLDAPTVVLPRVDYGGQAWHWAEPDTTQPIALPPGRAPGAGRWTFEPHSDSYVWFPANCAS